MSIALSILGSVMLFGIGFGIGFLLAVAMADKFKLPPQW